MSKPDVDRALQRDMQRFRQLNETGMPGKEGIIEYTFWGLMGIFGILLVVIMPWVGPDGVISGQLWLGGGLLLIGLFGGCAMVVRWIRNSDL